MGNHAVTGTDIKTLFSLGISYHEFDGFTVDPEARKVSLNLIPRPFLGHKFGSSWTASWLAIKFKEPFRYSLRLQDRAFTLITEHGNVLQIPLNIRNALDVFQNFPQHQHQTY